MRTLNDYFITSAIPDVSTASSTFVCVPDGGSTNASKMEITYVIRR